MIDVCRRRITEITYSVFAYDRQGLLREGSAVVAN